MAESRNRTDNYPANTGWYYKYAPATWPGAMGGNLAWLGYEAGNSNTPLGTEYHYSGQKMQIIAMSVRNRGVSSFFTACYRPWWTDAAANQYEFISPFATNCPNDSLQVTWDKYSNGF